MSSERANQQPTTEVPELLVQAGQGDQDAWERLLPLVDAELRRLAERQMQDKQTWNKLGVSGLVNAAFGKLADQVRGDSQSRQQFYSAAARAMRRILIDYARRRSSEQPAADRTHTAATEKGVGFDSPLDELIALDDALSRMGQVDARIERLVEYRFFCGLSEEETAELLSIPLPTLKREWVRARAWLYRDLYVKEP
ncbi:MAG: RNA polymerase subunit sigma-70 [bacterium]|nr:RNA polymerase subunit sigma-70 [bacterium]